ncbi:probable WRKY transcription factor 24 [Impatiens glandulifera]|uniref:probable WRKY transcription factor 24 n=1 Tax=Impatiens glandulifera TaxID=253017 RepID=UPI001FB14B9A|nr:probable WRKY transcription factor 24 [Impatiens glandulifera]
MDGPTPPHDHDHDHSIISMAMDNNDYVADHHDLIINPPFLSMQHDHHNYQYLPPLPMVAQNPNHESLLNAQLLIPPDIGTWFSNVFPSSSSTTTHNPSLLCGSTSLPPPNTGGGLSAKGRIGRRNKRVVPRRVAFQTRSSEDVLDDGYRWRKYGQKAVKNSVHPRSYYRCTHHTCNVKKQIQRLAKDTSIVVTTYEGIHNHPCEKLMETLTPLLKQLHFLSRF